MNSTNERLVIVEPCPAVRAEVLTAFFADSRRRISEQREAAEAALPALDRLAEVMRHRTDQGYTLRQLLYSLWNGGKPAVLLEMVTLDWEIRRDLCTVLLAFGFEEKDGVKFFYDAIKGVMVKTGQFDWFIAEGEVKEVA